MSTARVAGKPVLAVVATLLVIAADALLWHHLPVKTDVYAPFDVPGTLGAAVTGRAFEITADSVEISPEARDRYLVPAAGRWVAITVTAAATTAPVAIRGELRVGANTYTPTDRFLTKTVSRFLESDIEQHGRWLFDVAADLVDPVVAVPFQLRVFPSDDRLDNQVVIDLAGRAPTRLDTITVTAPEGRGR